MVRFSCFAAPNNFHRPKKDVQNSDAAMRTSLHRVSQDQLLKTLKSLSSRNGDSTPSTSGDQIVSPSSCWKSEDLNDNLSHDESRDTVQTSHLKKSQSLGCILEKGGGFYFNDVSEDNEMYRASPSQKSQGEAFNQTVFSESCDTSKPHVNPETNKHAEPIYHESLFSIGGPKQFDLEQADDASKKSTDCAADCAHSLPETPSLLARSHSVTSLNDSGGESNVESPRNGIIRPRSKSFEDLSLHSKGNAATENDDGLYSPEVFHMPKTSSYSHDITNVGVSYEQTSIDKADIGQGSNRSDEDKAVDYDEDGLSWREKVKYENQSVDVDDSHSYTALLNGWREQKYINEGEEEHGIELETSTPNVEQLVSKEFNIRRIEDWISQIDIENSCSFFESGESSNSEPVKEHHVEASLPAANVEGKSSPGVDAAYKYMSSLTAASASAQMANLGLVATPFLSAFVSLKLLNLSGNSIARITVGALPRGLHMLNLSKNRISTIEGLRELTRLRVLDLSYNKISRIGHGLASCSSVKELYLAGNKISEVEGLHRLLKLHILDLRLNKISTSKGIGQLAANYMSLQAINLEGNPAQRNVGDEHLKKYLLSLLPNLVYFNKQTIKKNSMKEIAERSTRSITSHHFARSDNKHSRRGLHGTNLQKSSNSSRSNLAGRSLSSQSKGRNSHLPPSASKLPPASSNKPLISDLSNGLRRIRSEGAF